jgi:hypothetical protein
LANRQFDSADEISIHTGERFHLIVPLGIPHVFLPFDLDFSAAASS